MIAMPWLVLWLMDDPLVLGTVLALAGIPRAVFMLIGNGYFVITTITLLQQSTPREMLGRLMSLLLFASTGLLPLSEALSGAVSRWSLTALFVGSGILMFVLAFWAATQSHAFQEQAIVAEQILT